MQHLLVDPGTFDEKTQEKLRMLETIFKRWNKNLNLVSAKDEALIWERHIVDSLQPISVFKDAHKVADMGAGAGLPSLPMAIACPEIDFFAIETNQKKCSLMQEIIREVRIPNFHVLGERVEKVYLSHMDAVCCRAFGEFHRDAKLAYKMLKPLGQFITFKTDPEDDEPIGYETLENHPYVLPNYPRKFFVVVTEKAGES
jgi:16S rRNA (guanine527-N7)-methyltransferase